MKLRMLAIGLAASTLGCVGPTKSRTRPPQAQATEPRTPTEVGVNAQALSPWVKRYHDARYGMWPRLSEDPRHRAKLESVTAAKHASYAAELNAIAQGLRKLDASSLDEQDRVSYDMLLATIEDQLRLAAFRDYEITFSSDSGFFSELPGMYMQLGFEGRKDYQDYLTRLSSVATLIDEHIANMRTGAKRGFTAPIDALPAALSNIAIEKDRAPEASPFYRPFAQLPETWPEPQKREFRLAAKAIIAEQILPAYQRLYTFLDQEYRNFARQSEGVWSLPDGPAYYQALITHHTDGNLSAMEIHEIGLKEVRRIESEMEAIRTSIAFKGTHKDFLNFLRNDPQFYVKTPKELLMYASYLAKRIDAQLPKYFHRLPPRPYGVFPVPDAIAPYYTAGRYAPAGATTNAAAQYWVNTHKLESRPLYALPALTAHEAVPGHHLQISLHQAMENLPLFRREASSSAYIEGWALYSERLAKDMGIYETAYDDFGRLNYEMWRACRLVVDTGIHALKWTRSHAIEFMVKHTALSLHEIETEVDRYISWPGQALAYKMGEIEIRNLKKLAKAQLGPKFDIRDFHEVILQAGPIPLSSLRQRVQRWISASLAKTT